MFFECHIFTCKGAIQQWSDIEVCHSETETGRPQNLRPEVGVAQLSKMSKQTPRTKLPVSAGIEISTTQQVIQPYKTARVIFKT